MSSLQRTSLNGAVIGADHVASAALYPDLKYGPDIFLQPYSHAGKGSVVKFPLPSPVSTTPGEASYRPVIKSGV
jgi:hypothetical protein